MSTCFFGHQDKLRSSRRQPYLIAAASVEVIPIPTARPLYATITVLLQLYMASARRPPISRISQGRPSHHRSWPVVRSRHSTREFSFEYLPIVDPFSSVQQKTHNVFLASLCCQMEGTPVFVSQMSLSRKDHPLGERGQTRPDEYVV